MDSVSGFAETYGSGEYVLRRMTPDDVGERYLSWMQDPDVIRYLQARFQPWSIDALKDFAAGFDHRNGFLFSVVHAGFGIQVGTVTLRCNPNHHFGIVGFMIGARDHWGRSAAKTAVSTALDFAFFERGLRKVIGTTTGNHDASKRIFSSLGFSLDAVVPDLYWSDGAYQDEIHFSLRAADWAKLVGKDLPDEPPPPYQPIKR